MQWVAVVSEWRYERWWYHPGVIVGRSFLMVAICLSVSSFIAPPGEFVNQNKTRGSTGYINLPTVAALELSVYKPHFICFISLPLVYAGEMSSFELADRRQLRSLESPFKTSIHAGIEDRSAHIIMIRSIRFLVLRNMVRTILRYI